MNEIAGLGYILACLICAVGTSIAFNRPTWSRSYTTAARFRWALLVHIALYLLILLTIQSLLKRGFPANGHWLIDARNRSFLIWIALILTLALRAASSRPRDWLLRLAGVPGFAKNLATQLAAGELRPVDLKWMAQARSTLLTRGIDVDAHLFPPAQHAKDLLLKAAALFLQIRAWEHQRQFADFMRETKHDADVLRRRFDRLVLRISRSFISIERLAAARLLLSSKNGETGDASRQADDLVRKIVADLIADCCEDISVFYADTCLLAARGILATRHGVKARANLISGLGFDLERDRLGAVSYGFLLPMAVLLYAGLWVCFLILPASAAGQTLEIGARVLIVTLIVFGGLAVAIVPKMRWGFANGDLHDKSPKFFVAAAGLFAVLLALLVNLCAGALLIGGLTGALQRVQEGAPYLPSAFLTGATMAWLAQDRRWRSTSSPRSRRFRDAAAFGFVWLLSSVIAYLLRNPPYTASFVPVELIVPAIVGLVFGAVIGFAIPEHVRRDEARRPVPFHGSSRPVLRALPSRALDA